MKKYFFAMLLLLVVGLLSGQTWIRNYPFADLCPGPSDGASSEVCNVIPAIGGGYLLQGYVQFSWGGIPAYSASVFWKLDENGDIIWRRPGAATGAFDSIVSNGVDRYYCLETSSGLTSLFVFDDEMNYLAHYWFHNINGYNASLFDMQYVNDGLVFAGKIGGQAVVLKTDFQFNVVWQSDPFWAFHEARSIEPYGDGWISLSRRVFTEINAAGDTLWTFIDNVNSSSLFDVTVAIDGSVYILVLDAIGYKIVRVNLINQSFDDVAQISPFHLLRPNQSISGLPNGNLVYLGSEYGGQVLHSYSPDGEHQWSRSYNTLGAIYFGTGSKNLLVMPDGSILFCMYHGNIVLVKTDSNGNVANDDPVVPTAVASIMAYPQPASSKVMISVKSEQVGDLGYGIYSIRGQKVYSGKLTGQAMEQIFELPNEALERMRSGVYLISLNRGNIKIATTKLVVVK